MPEMDMRRMQEEAARRAREMQSRARQSRPRPMETAPQAQTAQPGRPRQANTPAPEPPPAPPPEAPAPQAVEAAIPAIQAEAPGGPAPKSLLDELFMDRERTVLLALLLLLSGEEGSHELMFALLFLLM